MPIVKSKNCFGIYPTDIIVRGAVLSAFRELREQPWLLDFAFQALLNDVETVEQYGAAALEEARDWFLANEIKVTLGYKINNISIPHVAIWLGPQSESDLSLGDVNDVAQENDDWVMTTRPVLTFTASAYDLPTGTITLPPGQTTTGVFPGMRLIDRQNGLTHVIMEIIDDQNFRIGPDIQVNLNRAQVCAEDNLWRVRLESIANTETCNLDCVVQGDVTKCIVLHAILRWALNRSKQRLLEGRGFERTSLSSQGIENAQDGDNAAQILFRRRLTITGVTKEYWPKDVTAPVSGVAPSLGVPAGAETGLIDSLEESQGWSTTDPKEDVLGG